MKEAKDVAKGDKKLMKVHAFEEGKDRVSTAQECNEILEKQESIEKKRETKRRSEYS